MQELIGDLTAVGQTVLAAFRPVLPLHQIILFGGQARFRAYVFYVTQRDVERLSGTQAEESLRAAIRRELQATGSGRSDGLDLSFVFDSYESVKQRFNGSYDRYFR